MYTNKYFSNGELMKETGEDLTSSGEESYSNVV